MDLGTAADTATAGANVEASSSSCADFVFDALIAALGTQRDRYATASELQSYSGIAPVLASSGKQHWVHWRWACPKFLRQTFHEWAAHSIGSSDWAKAYYE